MNLQINQLDNARISTMKINILLLNKVLRSNVEKKSNLLQILVCIFRNVAIITKAVDKKIGNQFKPDNPQNSLKLLQLHTVCNNGPSMGDQHHHFPHRMN